MTRLAILVSHPIQYFAPWHREAAKLPSFDLRVFFFSRWGISGAVDPGFGKPLIWDVPLLEGYEHEFLPMKEELSEMDFGRIDNPSVAEALDRFNPDVVNVYGYAQRTNWRAARWAKSRRKPLLIYSDSNIRLQSLFRRILKYPVVGRFYRYVDGAIYIGERNRAYHAFYGLPPDRLFQGSLPVDTERLLTSAGDREITRRNVRERHGIPMDAFVVLFVGKLLPRKRPIDLVLAMDILRHRHPKLCLLFVGDGPLRQEVEALCKSRGATNVVFSGFINQSEIASYYAASDAIALLSAAEPFGIVLSEAAVFGLPMLVSDIVGAIGAGDVARPGESALVHRCGDVQQLAANLESLMVNPDLYHRLAAASAEVARNSDVRLAARQLQEAVEALTVLGKR